MRELENKINFPLEFPIKIWQSSVSEGRNIVVLTIINSRTFDQNGIFGKDLFAKYTGLSIWPIRRDKRNAVFPQPLVHTTMHYMINTKHNNSRSQRLNYKFISILCYKLSIHRTKSACTSMSTTLQFQNINKLKIKTGIIYCSSPFIIWYHSYHSRF